MGCDYYIIKQLRIEHSDGVDIIELDRERCYFPEHHDDDYDSDDTINNIDLRYQQYLKVTFKPRVLCDNGNWKNEKVRDKYIDRIYDKLKHYNNAFYNINTVIKEEVRY